MLVMDRVVYVAPAQLVEGPAEKLFCSRVHERHRPLAVHGIESFTHVLHHRVIELLRTVQTFLGLL